MLLPSRLHQLQTRSSQIPRRIPAHHDEAPTLRHAHSLTKIPTSPLRSPKPKANGGAHPWRSHRAPADRSSSAGWLSGRVGETEAEESLTNVPIWADSATLDTQFSPKIGQPQKHRGRTWIKAGRSVHTSIKPSHQQLRAVTSTIGSHAKWLPVVLQMALKHRLTPVHTQSSPTSSMR